MKKGKLPPLKGVVSPPQHVRILFNLAIVNQQLIK